MKERILVIEDEVQIAKMLQIELELEGYDVLVEHNGKSGLAAALQEKIDLILLDILLPGLNGMEVLRKIRNADPHVPVILLTARDLTLDKVLGLDQGANDYITKPYESEELMARIRACIRTRPLLKIENNIDEETLLTLKDLTLNPATREVMRTGKSISLTPKEYDLLFYLLTNKNQIVTRESIIINVWGYEYEGDTNVLDVYMRYLRKKIESGFDEPLIHTVRGVGYIAREK
ncbi:response regulator transcription factor [Fictibacillus sp. KU28468]|uniref:response regulator transcription factor n=1 Tax=Fictibacillus sp. KU28468 TaxID=2991053 RepID=UPI00223D62B6|nr:response regulator transcription factor [Fictibacillus sp. KU28468]UZJ77788.1 response regulator transcription factor [Fictibacillus sp. KU28468]